MLKSYLEDKNGDFIEREIFKAAVTSDGRYSDLTQDERNKYVKNVYKNTLEYILNYGISIPIKSGHMDLSQAAKGYITGIKLKKYNSEDIGLVYSITASMFLYEPYYSEYREGKFPGVSVEIHTKGFLENGKEFGDHLGAVAMLGIDMAAYPLLSHEMSSKGDILTFSTLGPRTYTTNEVDFSKKEFKMATRDEVLAKFQELAAMVQNLQDLIVAEEATEEETGVPAEDLASEEKVPEKEEEEMATEEVPEKKKEEEMKMEYSKLKSEKIDFAYEKLAFAGKIGKDQKANFIKIANSTGLDTAISIYSAMDSKVPPTGKVITSSKDGIISTEKMNAINMLSRNNSVLKNALIEKAKKEGN